MFLNYYSDNDELKQFDITSFNYWENLSINVGDKEIKLIELLNTIRLIKTDIRQFYKSKHWRQLQFK